MSDQKVRWVREYRSAKGCSLREAVDARYRFEAGELPADRDFDAEHAARLVAERQVGEFREQLAYEVADHRTTQICRDGWRNNCEEANAKLETAMGLLRVSKDIVAISKRIDKEAFAKGIQNVDLGAFKSLAYALERIDLAEFATFLNTTSTEGKDHE